MLGVVSQVWCLLVGCVLLVCGLVDFSGRLRVCLVC